MKVLVTGGAGFIGCHVIAKLLRRGDTVVNVDELNDYYDVQIKNENLMMLYCLAKSLQANVSCPPEEFEHGNLVAGRAFDHTGAPFSADPIEMVLDKLGKPVYTVYKADIADEAIMEAIFAREKPDIVCHLAARAGVRSSLLYPAVYVRSNVQGTTVLLNLSQRFKIKNFVYASSSSVYGNSNEIPFSESSSEQTAVSPYAATKQACERMAATYSLLYNLPCTGLRFFTVYGPRGRPDMAPYIFVDRICRGEEIHQYGDGSTRRDYTYIDDIVRGVLASIDRPMVTVADRGSIARHEVINLGNATVVSLAQFIETIENVVGRHAVRKILPMQPGDVPLTYADVSKARRLLDYEPTTPIDVGIAAFYRWYKNRNALLATKRPPLPALFCPKARTIHPPTQNKLTVWATKFPLLQMFFCPESFLPSRQPASCPAHKEEAVAEDMAADIFVTRAIQNDVIATENVAR